MNSIVALHPAFAVDHARAQAVEAARHAERVRLAKPLRRRWFARRRPPTPRPAVVTVRGASGSTYRFGT